MDTLVYSHTFVDSSKLAIAAAEILAPTHFLCLQSPLTITISQKLQETNKQTKQKMTQITFTFPQQCLLINSLAFGI